MTSETDIYRTANVWIRQHGDKAHKLALEMAEVYAGRDEPEGAALWRRIAVAVRELQRMERPEGTSEH